MVKVIAEGVGTELPEMKRCYINGVVLKSTCPNCGRKYERDLSSQYLSYGSLDVSWYCEDWEWNEESDDEEDLGCGQEWETPLRVEIRFFSADEPSKSDKSRLYYYNDERLENAKSVLWETEELAVAWFNSCLKVRQPKQATLYILEDDEIKIILNKQRKVAE